MIRLMGMSLFETLLLLSINIMRGGKLWKSLLTCVFVSEKAFSEDDMKQV